MFEDTNDSETIQMAYLTISELATENFKETLNI